MFLCMKPICKCGHIFEKFTMGPMLFDDSVLFFTRPFINIDPPQCPVCKEKIEGIIYQHPVDGSFEYDEKKYKTIEDSDTEINDEYLREKL